MSGTGFDYAHEFRSRFADREITDPMGYKLQLAIALSTVDRPADLPEGKTDRNEPVSTLFSPNGRLVGCSSYWRGQCGCSRQPVLPTDHKVVIAGPGCTGKSTMAAASRGVILDGDIVAHLIKAEAKEPRPGWACRRLGAAILNRASGVAPIIVGAGYFHDAFVSWKEERTITRFVLVPHPTDVADLLGSRYRSNHGWKPTTYRMLLETENMLSLAYSTGCAPYSVPARELSVWAESLK